MELLQVCATSEPSAFRLIGELDLSSFHSLSNFDVPASGADLILDLADLRFVDGAGLDSLSELARRLSGHLVLENARLPVEKLIRKVIVRDRLGNVVISSRSPVNDSDAAAAAGWDPSRCLVTEQTPESLCRLLVTHAGKELGGNSFVSASLIDGSHTDPTAFNHPVAAELDCLQASCGEGPILKALHDRAIVGSPSLIEERRWPEFTNQALYSGVASVAVIPLQVGEQMPGVLSLYGQRERVFTEEKIQGVSALAGQAAVAIANAGSYWTAKELIRQLQEALESRAVIDQAKGVLMALDGVTADEAFRILRKASQRGNLKVRDLAKRVVENSSRPQGRRGNDSAVAGLSRTV